MTTIVTHRHMRELNYCNRGAREFFSKHGLDWGDFLRNGIDVRKIEAIGDAMAMKVVAHARKEVTDGRQQ